MTLHFSSLRSLLLFGLCACLSLQVGRSAPQNSEQTPTKTPAPIVHFTDVAAKVGLTASVVFGGEKTKKYIIETTGTGVAIFDYDNDGWPDIFRSEERRVGKECRSGWWPQLYRKKSERTMSGNIHPR